MILLFLDDFTDPISSGCDAIDDLTDGAFGLDYLFDLTDFFDFGLLELILEPDLSLEW